MPTKTLSVKVEAKSEIELLTLETTIREIEKLQPDQLKRVGKLLKSKKAMDYLSSDTKFLTLQTFL